MSIPQPWHGRLASPIRGSLCVNSYAGPDDVAIIEETLRRTDETIDAINDELLQHMHAIRSLVQEKEVFVSFRKDHARLIHPMLRLPTEIWAQIFGWACASTFRTSRPSSHSTHSGRIDSLLPHNPVKVIGQVCASWRNMMHSLPEMWTHLLLRESCRESTLSLAIRLNAFSRALERSCTLPLHITLCVKDVATDLLSVKFVELAIRALMRHHNRWQCIDIYDGKGLHATKAFTSCITDHHITKLPLLEELSFEGRPLKVAQMSSRLAFPSLQFPKLRSAWIHGGFLDLRPESLPWAQLKHVSFMSISPSGCFSLLPRLTNVAKISISWSDNPHAAGNPLIDPAMMSGFTLHHLETLNLYDWDSTIMRAVKMPNLRSLYLGSLTSGNLTQLVDFIRQSNCRITWFSAKNLLFYPIQGLLTAFLSCVPHLEYLHLDGIFGRGDEDYRILLDMLMKQNDDGTPCYCPHLATIRLHRHFWKRPTLAKAVEMVEFRWNARRETGSGDRISGLKRVGEVDLDKWTQRSGSSSKATLQLFERLRRLEGKGLAISFVQVVPPHIGH